MKFKLIAFTLAAMVLIVPTEAEAKGKGNNNNQNKQAQAAKKKREEEQKAREKKREAMEAFMKKRDTNHDGSLTREEYLSGESDAAAGGKTFDQYNANKDRYLTKIEIEALLRL